MKHFGIVLLLLGCGVSEGPAPMEPPPVMDPPGSQEDAGEGDAQVLSNSDLADVIEVAVTGATGSYTFAVTIRSPDEGCERYADFWEVIRADGTLVYRRILAHSHVGEQPFTRTGGPVGVAESEEVIVRAHMRPGGYGGVAMRGSVMDGFVVSDVTADFAAELVEQDPLPADCAF